MDNLIKKKEQVLMKSLRIGKSCVSSLTTLIVLLLSLVNTAYAEQTTTYFHTDALGSVVAASDESGSLLWRKGYSPYGEKLTDGEGKTNAIAYTGKPHDDVTGLTYMGARYYDPEIGRFMGMDPVGFKESNPMMFNRYAYANNNPYKFVDPDGRESFLVSRQLGFTTKGNHNFIVSNANHLGDPSATVSSFGDVGNDTMGQVDKSTKGFSQGTNQTDTKAWKSLAGNQASATYRKIKADDKVVDFLVNKMPKGLEYNAVPEIQGGVNSNTVAGAVAKRADGGRPYVPNGVRQPSYCQIWCFGLKSSSDLFV